MGHAENGYDLIDVEVATEAGAVFGRTYIAEPDPRRSQIGLTSARYRRHLVEGAMAHGLPEPYLAMLRTIPTFD